MTVQLSASWEGKGSCDLHHAGVIIWFISLAIVFFFSTLFFLVVLSCVYHHQFSLSLESCHQQFSTSLNLAVVFFQLSFFSLLLFSSFQLLVYITRQLNVYTMSASAPIVTPVSNSQACSLLTWKDPVQTGKVFGGILAALIVFKFVNLINVFFHLSYLGLLGMYQINWILPRMGAPTGEGIGVKNLALNEMAGIERIWRKVDGASERGREGVRWPANWARSVLCARALAYASIQVSGSLV